MIHFRSNYNSFYRITAGVLIFLHLLTFGPVREAAAFSAQSTSYRLNCGVLSQGSGRRGAGSCLLWDTLGESCAGKVESDSYRLESGFIPTIEINPPAQVKDIPGQIWNVNEEKEFDLNGYFISPDGYKLSYDLTGNSRIGFSIDQETLKVKFTPPADWEGAETIKFIVTDTQGGSIESNAVSLRVGRGPVIESAEIFPQNIVKGDLVTLTVRARVLDTSEEINFSYNSFFKEEKKWQDEKDPGVWYSQSAWQTNSDNQGDYLITVSASGSQEIPDSKEVNIHIKDTNHAPVLAELEKVKVKEGDLVVITPLAEDVDGDGIIYYFSSSVPVDKDGKWLTGYEDAGEHIIKVTASDERDSDTKEVIVEAENVNRNPQVELKIDKQTAFAKEKIGIEVTAVDNDQEDAGKLSYILKRDGVEISSGKIESSYTTNIEFSDVGNYTIQVTVKDGSGGSVRKEKGIHIDSPDYAVTAVMGDFNGDALTDLGVHNFSNGKWEISLSEGGKFPNLVIRLEDFGASRDWLPLGGDFNGDGKSDIAIYNWTNGELKIALSQLSYTDTNATQRQASFTDKDVWLRFSQTGASWQPWTGNFNGDKYTDFAVYNKDTGEVRVALGRGTKDEGGGTSGFGVLNSWLGSSAGNAGYVAMAGDFNGDSLTDICLFDKKSGEFKVAFSNTKEFVDGASWISGFGVQRAGGDREQNLVADFNNDGLTDIGYREGAKWFYALSNGARFIIKDDAWLNGLGTEADESSTSGDFNGDGITDAAVFDKDQIGIFRWTILVREDRKPADLLKEINNGIGGSTKIEYSYASKTGNELLPFPVYITESVTMVDSLPIGQPQESYSQKFSYSGGYYDVVEREFRGFEKVRVTDPVTGNYTETYFHQGKVGEDGALKGQIARITAYDGNKRQISETINSYKVKKAGSAEKALGFPSLEEQTTTVWEENNTSITTKSNFTYDNIGNLLGQGETVDITNSAVAVEDRPAVLKNTGKTTRTIYAKAYELEFNRPKEVTAKDKDKAIISQKRFVEYDSRGNLLKEETRLYNSLTQEETYIPATYEYDSFGNLTASIDALERRVSTEYETAFNTYPEKITNALGHSITYIYEPKFGVVRFTIDSNKLVSELTYDSLGRLTGKQVYPQLTSEVAEGLLAGGVGAAEAILEGEKGATLVTYSYPDFNTKITSNAIGLSSTEYIDGLGRKYKTVSAGEDGNQARDVVSEIFYNNRGLTERESLAHYIDEEENQISYIRYEYDIRGRVKKTISDFPGTGSDAGSSITYNNLLDTETIDPKGQRKGVLKDIYGNNIVITEFTTDGVFKTKYEYDAQNNLTKVTDAKGNISEIIYDSLGRKIKMNDPDMGTWAYEYDKLGNLKIQTDAKGQVLGFEYDALNRLTRKTTCGVAAGLPAGEDGTSVTYIYDDPAKANCVGRLSKVTDQSGSTEFFYDRLGREIESVKTIQGTGYRVQREYDILDRLTKLTYPDGESVNYEYDVHSGLLEKVYSFSQTPESSPLNPDYYIKNINYNAKGQIKDILYGNNAQTIYDYGQDLRLSRILTRTQTPAPRTLIDLNYIFDKNGNLTTLTDNLRNNIRSFIYDDLDRLKEAQNVPAAGGGYTNYSYRYDSIGNMTYKSDIGEMGYGTNTSEVSAGLLVGGVGVAAGLLGCGVGKPHALTSAGGYSYQYDANGNMTAGKNKTLAYDVENRLIQVNESGIITSFIYDGDGGRVKKTRIEDGRVKGEITYVGSLFEIESENESLNSEDGGAKIEVRKKHIFAGANRICTIELQSSNLAPRIYYYHTDHLGSSNIITDATGAQAASYEYTPYGSLVNQSSPINLPTSYLYTGKELDATGLYYYGARYYDPQIGRFITADTIVQSPYDPQSLNRYSYCRNNPVNYVDPTGHSWFSNFFKKFGGTIASIAFTFIGMPFIGAIVGSAISTFANGGNFQNFATGFGIGVVSGFMGGTIAGGMARGLNWNMTGIETALLRGGFAGAVGGMGSAAAYGGNIGEGAWQGAAGGMVVGGLVWAKNAYTTNKFLKNNVEWDETTNKGIDRAKMVQTIKEFGQSPVGQRTLSKYLSRGEELKLSFEYKTDERLGGGYGWGGGKEVTINPTVDMDLATLFAHEIGHTTPVGKYEEALTVSYIENPYRAWVGLSRNTFYPSIGVKRGIIHQY